MSVKFNEAGLRPLTLSEYKGQDKIKKALTFYIKAAQMRGECLDHVLISGPSGLGKTTLCNIIGNEMNKNVFTVAAPVLKTPEDLIDKLLTLEENDILFIDEIHRLSKKVEEVLYFAMEDFTVDIKSEGVQERVMLKPFTLIGATTIKGLLSEPLINRFHISVELTPYSEDHVSKIVNASVNALGGIIDEVCAKMIADRSRGVPRIANGFVKRILDFALVMNEGKISEEVVEEAFDFLEIDKNGLTPLDKRYLKILGKEFSFKAVGLDTLCSMLNEDKRTIENTIEPYLMQKGFVRKTPRGRVITNTGFNLL